MNKASNYTRNTVLIWVFLIAMPLLLVVGVWMILNQIAYGRLVLVFCCITIIPFYIALFFLLKRYYSLVEKAANIYNKHILIFWLITLPIVLIAGSSIGSFLKDR